IRRIAAQAAGDVRIANSSEPAERNVETEQNNLEYIGAEPHAAGGDSAEIQARDAKNDVLHVIDHVAHDLDRAADDAEDEADQARERAPEQLAEKRDDRRDRNDDVFQERTEAFQNPKHRIEERTDQVDDAFREIEESQVQLVKRVEPTFEVGKKANEEGNDKLDDDRNYSEHDLHDDRHHLAHDRHHPLDDDLDHPHHDSDHGDDHGAQPVERPLPAAAHLLRLRDPLLHRAAHFAPNHLAVLMARLHPTRHRAHDGNQDVLTPPLLKLATRAH